MRSSDVQWRVIVLLTVLSGALLAPIPVQGQSGADLRARVESMPGQAAIRAFIASRVAKGFTPPKTPWGDPDISANSKRRGPVTCSGVAAGGGPKPTSIVSSSKVRPATYAVR